jgi:amidophosphoribosyltransferase
LNGNEKEIIDGIYQKCIKSLKNNSVESINYVKELYKPFSYQEISDKIAELLVDKDINSEVKIIFQKVEDLHKACPNHKGDWYFTGNYPTPGGSKIANKSFINFYEGKSQRAY